MARIGIVLGTRPEVVKLAPVVAALRATGEHDPVVISTGQHRDLLRPLLADFDVAPACELELMAGGQRLSDLAGRAVSRIGAALADLDVDAVIVRGDTTTTLAGAIAGCYAQLPVVHLEAGLRTDNRRSPFPEEINRRAVTQFADLHLAPTSPAADRLLAEGVDPARVVITGNTVVDSLFATVRRDRPFTGPDAARLRTAEATTGPLLLVTAHRRESWDGGIAAIAAAVRRLAADHPDLTVVFPVHPNPVVRSAVLPELGTAGQVVLTEPLDYPDFVRVLRRSDLVLTDSGGIQEEACSLGIPTLVARDTTERPEGADAGGLLLVGTEPDRIHAEAHRLLADPEAYRRARCTSLPFGDGHAAVRVVAALDLVLAPAPAHTRSA